ncbi:MAG: hypothetical protein IPG97_08665 [Microthrixaceae bacterium]|nr:hypothetical protein [Microthrixaceae bacterium]
MAELCENADVRRILLVIALSLLVGCGDETPSASIEDFCSIVRELEGASDASLAAVFGQGFDAPVLTPSQVEEAFDRLRGIQGRLSEAAPDDAPEAIDRYVDIRSDYMDAVAERGFDPDPATLDGDDPRVLAWQDESTRVLEEEIGSYAESTCQPD